MVHKKLLRWYDQNKRNLPWRHDRDPYKVWISEIMLQQTQVKTVIPYFNKFTNKFKTIKDLSKSKEREILKMWEGLAFLLLDFRAFVGRPNSQVSMSA